MGISDKIKIIPSAYYCRSGNYLAFSRKPGHAKLAAQFGDALLEFKTTETYRQIMLKYGR